MRFIHCADLHLASKLESRFSPEKAKIRRRELFETFRRIADDAETQGVRAVLISGDIFDEGKPPVSAVKQFIEIVKAHPAVDFLCLAGNHDESLAGRQDLPENLLTFDDQWKYYSYEDADIYGVELTKANCAHVAQSLRMNENRVNIVMLHGQVVESSVQPDDQTIVLPLFSGKGIDYMALGHIHSYKTGALDRRGVWCYSGTPEGRGFDECGEKGCVWLDVEKGKLQSEFIPCAKRTIRSVVCDLTGANGDSDVEERVKDALSSVSKEDIVQLRLVGSLPAQTRFHLIGVRACLENGFFGYELKNAVKTAIDPEEYKDVLSLKGEFIRRVSAEDLPEEEKARIIRCGLLALEGEEVDEI